MPRHCIVPPYLLREIAARASGDLRALAIESLAESDRIRSARAAAGPRPSIQRDTSRRAVYDARGTTSLPGRLVRGNGDPPSGDVEVDEAYEGLGATYALFHAVYGRHSIDAHD